LRLITGAFRAITGSIGKLQKSKFEVETRVATIGIRGTDFWGGFTFGDALDVALLGGKGINIRNGSGRVDIDKVGLGTTVKSSTSVPTPQKSTSWGQ